MEPPSHHPSRRRKRDRVSLTLKNQSQKVECPQFCVVASVEGLSELTKRRITMKKTILFCLMVLCLVSIQPRMVRSTYIGNAPTPACDGANCKDAGGFWDWLCAYFQRPIST